VTALNLPEIPYAYAVLCVVPSTVRQRFNTVA